MKRSDLIIYWGIIATELENDRLSLRNANGTAALYNAELKDALNRLNEAYKAGQSTGNWTYFDNALKQVVAVADEIVPQLSNKLVQDSVRAVERVLDGTYAAFSFGGQWESVAALGLTRAAIENAIATYKFGGRTIRQWMRRTVGSDWKELERDIVAAMRKGQNPQDIAKKWREYNRQTRRNITTLGLSYNAAVTTEARDEFYKKNDHLIKAYEWTAALEQGNTETGRGTCPRCAALDGQQWEKKSDAPPIPLHMRCRCVLLPITKEVTDKIDWKAAEAEARARLREEWGKSRPTKQQTGVPSYVWTNKDFSAWWAGQSKAWQDNAIGPRRAALVRSGKVPFKGLVDKKGILIPVKELEERNA